MHSEKIPKTLQREIDRHAHKIDSYHMEEDFFGEPGQGSWSIWIGFNPEWECPDMECGTIHEATAKDAIEKLRGAVLKEIL